MLAAACWFVTGAFPLAAEPQMVADAPGVSVELSGAQLMHRSSVPYPQEALQKGVQGTVVVQVKLDDKGDVSDASVLSGPDELRKASIQSVLNWHFTQGCRGSIATGPHHFRIAENETRRLVGVVGGVPGGVVGGVIGGVPEGVRGGVIGGIVGSVPSRMPVPNEGTLRNINVVGLSDQVRGELLSRLPVHVGDVVSGDQIQKVREAVSEYDEHSRFGSGSMPIRKRPLRSSRRAPPAW